MSTFARQTLSWHSPDALADFLQGRERTSSIGPEILALLTEEVTKGLKVVKSHICPDCRERQAKLAAVFGAKLS